MKNESNRDLQRQAYEVSVGFTRVRVEGRTPDEAIQNARRKLCVELPRMWDVISNMSDQSFVVESSMR